MPPTKASSEGNKFRPLWSMLYYSFSLKWVIVILLRNEMFWLDFYSYKMGFNLSKCPSQYEIVLNA